MFKDNAVFSSSNLRETMGPAMGDQIILGMDEPEHRRHRALVSTAFRQRALARWEQTPRPAGRDELIDDFVDRGQADLVTDFTFLFPLQGRRRRARAARRGLPPVPAVGHRHHQPAHRLGPRHRRPPRSSRRTWPHILEERRRAPGDDIISDLAQAELDGERLERRGDLLVPAAAAPGRGRDHVPVERQPAATCCSPIPTSSRLCAGTGRCSRRRSRKACASSRRCSSPRRVATPDTQLSRRGDPGRVDGHADARRRQPRPAPSSPIPIGSTSSGTRISTSRSGTACTSASGMHLARMETRVALDALLDRLPNLRLDAERAAQRRRPHPRRGLPQPDLAAGRVGRRLRWASPSPRSTSRSSRPPAGSSPPGARRRSCGPRWRTTASELPPFWDELVGLGWLGLHVAEAAAARATA